MAYNMDKNIVEPISTPRSGLRAMGTPRNEASTTILQIQLARPKMNSNETQQFRFLSSNMINSDAIKNQPLKISQHARNHAPFAAPCSEYVPGKTMTPHIVVAIHKIPLMRNKTIIGTVYTKLKATSSTAACISGKPLTSGGSLR